MLICRYSESELYSRCVLICVISHFQFKYDLLDRRIKELTENIENERKTSKKELVDARNEFDHVKKELDDAKDQLGVLKTFDEEGQNRQKVFEKVERVRFRCLSSRHPN